jgi:hypothetical protein
MSDSPGGPPGERLPARPSYLRERTIRLAGPGGVERPVHLGMDRPTTSPDGWWTAVAWARDDDGVISCLDVAPRGGPPPEPPLMRMGPAFAGALSGLLAEVEGRQAVRLRLPAPAAPERPWDRPLVVQIALRWEPLRAATFTPDRLAAEALAALGRAIQAAGRAA